MAPRKNQAVATTTAPTTAVSAERSRPIDVFKNKVELASSQIMVMLPAHMRTPEGFAQFKAMVTTSVAQNEKLLECNPNSLLKATIEAAQLGLSLVPSLREADILPVWSPNGTVAQMRPRYMGLMKLARQSGDVKNIWAKVVFEHDEFQYDEGTHRDIKHNPFQPPTVRQFLAKKLGRPATLKDVEAFNKDAELQEEHANACDPGEMTHAYCCWTLADGTTSFEVFPRSKIMKSRDNSEGWKAFKAGKIKSTPWATYEQEMWQKTAVNLSSKYMPKSTDNFARAVDIDQRREGGENVTVDGSTGEVIADPSADDITAPPPAPSPAAKSQADRLASRIAPAPEPDMPPAPPPFEEGDDVTPPGPRRNWTAETDALIAELSKINDPREITAFTKKHAIFIGELEFGSPDDAERLNAAMSR